MPEKTAVVGVAELRELDMLGWLPAVRLEALSQRMTALRVKRGQVLYHPGQSARHIYCVLDGAVGLSLLSSEGRAVQRGWRRVSEATALQDSRVGRIEARTLVTDVCGLSWDLVTGLTETILKPLFLVSLRRSLFLVEELPDRVALALWEYAGHPEARRARGLLPATLTHEQLAAVVGASRPRVSLALKQLERHGLFLRDGRQIRVQEQRLRRYLERKYEFLL